MPDTLYVSTSGAVTRLQQLDVLANNLANANTVGFKSDQLLFGTTLEALERGEPGAYVEAQGVFTDHSQGSLSRSGRDLDVAIQGPGFFTVQTPAGVRYTRAGSFIVDAEGRLATPEGHPVLGEGGTIQGGRGALRIQSTGQVVDAQGIEIAKLRLETFDDPTSLEKEGTNLFRAPAAAVGVPVVNPDLLEHTVEQSNVSPTAELARMMILQRSFEASLRALRADDQATERLLQEMAQ